MRAVLPLFENAETDAECRAEARALFSKLKAFLKGEGNHHLIEPVDSPKFPGGMLVSGNLVDPDYYDLAIVLTSEPTEFGDYVSRGSFGVSSNGFKVIVLPCLLNPFDLTYADTRLNFSAFLHEFIHYLDHNRSKQTTNSIEMLKGKGDSAYFNDPGEFNSMFHEVAAKMENFLNNPKAKLGLFLSDWTSFQKLAERLAEKEWREMMSPKYRVKFLKRLYQLFNKLNDSPRVSSVTESLLQVYSA